MGSPGDGVGDFEVALVSWPAISRRHLSAPEMAFSNPTQTVKRSDRVDVIIGSFRATNLVVE